MTLSSLSLTITLVIFYTAGFPPSSATSGTFSIDLIHRDSIESPFYNSSMTFYQRLGHAVQRSFISAKHIDANCNLTRPRYQTQMIPDHGEFLLNISFGNPPHKVLVVADTASDLPWIQCNPCIQCFNHTKGSLFNPRTSSTYKPVGCKSQMCKAITTVKTNCSKVKTCQFDKGYTDGSFGKGDVSREIVTLGDRVLPDIVFGCAFSNGGVFTSAASGIVGLGGGDYSLVSQIRSFVPGKFKFSYCLIPFPLADGLTNKSSKITFGDIDFDSNSVWTPIVQKAPKTFYQVTLEAISVGNNRLNMSDRSISTKPVSKGNMIVDSGSTLTHLPHQLYTKVVADLKDALKLKTVEDPMKILDLCYHSSEVIKTPKFTIHFEGADVELSRDNIFVHIDDDVICFTFAPTKGQAVYGNLAQTNFMVGFDLDNHKMSFKPTNCENL